MIRPKPMPYLSFIDGMRAVAVLAVVFYHFGFDAVPGGFVGVDVFFVISGFLITGIIQRKLHAGSFSPADFYRRRFRRLLPAVAAVVMITLLTAPMVLTERALVDLSRSAIGVGLFASNIFFWTTDDYFADAATLKPLLHTWSLGVEEQFYAVFPLLLMLLGRVSRTAPLVGMSVLMLVSFGVNLHLSEKHPSAAFYLLPGRMWEFALGALLAMQATRLKEIPIFWRNAASLTGILLLGYSFVSISRHDVFPGTIVLVPVLGSCLIIAGALGGATVAGAALSTAPMRYTGLISYSLYLWHWVVSAYAGHLTAGEFSPIQQAVMIALTFALSVMTFRLIESPFRRVPRFSRWMGLRGGFATLAILVVSAATYGAYFEGRWLDAPGARRSAEELEMLKLFRLYPACGYSADFDLEQNNCSVGDRESEKTFLVWGDSHGKAALVSFDRAGKDRGWRGLNSSRPGCPPLLGVYTADNRKRCNPSFADEVADFLRRSPVDRVFLVGRWPLYQTGKLINGKLMPDTHFVSDSIERGDDAATSSRVLKRALVRTVDFLVSLGIPTTILAPTPVLPRRIEHYGPSDRPLAREAYMAQRAAIDPVLRQLAQHPLVSIMDPADLLCPEASCLLFEGNEPLYSDHNHLSVTGALRLGVLIERELASTPSSTTVTTVLGETF